MQRAPQTALLEKVSSTPRVNMMAKSPAMRVAQLGNMYKSRQQYWNLNE